MYILFPNQAADIIAVSTSLLDTLPAVTTPTESKLHASKEVNFVLVPCVSVRVLSPFLLNAKKHSSSAFLREQIARKLS
jgi:hypothetical protein